MSPDFHASSLSDLNGMVDFPGILLVSTFEREPSLYCFILRNTTDDNYSPDYRGNCRNIINRRLDVSEPPVRAFCTENVVSSQTIHTL